MTLFSLLVWLKCALKPNQTVLTDDTTAKSFSLWAKLITLSVINESSTMSLFDYTHSMNKFFLQICLIKENKHMEKRQKERESDKDRERGVVYKEVLSNHYVRF